MSQVTNIFSCKYDSINVLVSAFVEIIYRYEQHHSEENARAFAIQTAKIKLAIAELPSLSMCDRADLTKNINEYVTFIVDTLDSDMTCSERIDKLESRVIELQNMIKTTSTHQLSGHLQILRNLDHINHIEEHLNIDAMPDLIEDPDPESHIRECKEQIAREFGQQ